MSQRRPQMWDAVRARIRMDSASTSNVDPASERTVAAVVAALMTSALAVLPYLQTVSHEFAALDDRWLIVDNKTLHSLTWSSFFSILTDLSFGTRLSLGAEYLPVRDLSVALDLAIFGVHAPPILIHNAILYGLACGMWALVLRRWITDTRIALLAAIVFAVHPIHVESVAWCASRKDALSLFWGMVSLYAFERVFETPDGRRTARLAWLCASTGALLLASLSKYAAVVIGGIVFLRTLLLHVPSAPTDLRSRIVFAVRYTSPHLLVAASVSALAVHIGRRVHMFAAPIADDSSTVLATAVHTGFRYVGNLLVPATLSPAYPLKPVAAESTDGLLALGGGAVILGGAVVVLLARRAAARGLYLAAFGVVVFVVGWIPVSQLIPLQNKIADRYVLLPSLAVSLVIASALQLASSPRAKRMGWIAVSALSVILFGASWIQVSHWKTPISLWAYATTAQPSSANAWSQLAEAYRGKSRRPEERNALLRAIELQPDDSASINNLAINLVNARAQPAVVFGLYERLLSRAPAEPAARKTFDARHKKALQNYGILLVDVGRAADGIPLIERALAADPDYCKAQRSLGRVLSRDPAQTAKARRLMAQAQSCEAARHPALQYVAP